MLKTTLNFALFDPPCENCWRGGGDLWINSWNTNYDRTYGITWWLSAVYW